MGCSESAAVLNNSSKPMKVIEARQKYKSEESLHFLLGNIKQKQYLFAKVSLSNRSMEKLSIPINFLPHNFSSMLEYDTNKFAISGGINYDLTDITKDVVIYNAIQHSVKQLAPMNQPRYTHASLFYLNYLYVIGGRFFGQDDVAILKSCEKYSFQQNQWTPLPSLNVPRCTCYAFVWHDNIYVFGGYTGKYQRSKLIQKLNLKQNRWDILNFYINRGVQSSFVVSNNDNQITIFGGNTNSGPTSAVVTINLKEESVVAHKELREPKTLHKSWKFEQQIYILGGSQKLDLQIININQNNSKIVQFKFEEIQLEAFEVLTQSESNLIVNYNYSEPKQSKIVSSPSDEIVLIFGTNQEPVILQLNVSVPFSQICSVPLNLKLYSESGGICLSGLKFLMFGGIEADSLSFVSSFTFLYDHQNIKVKQLRNMNVARYSFSYQQIENRVYAIGGGSINSNGNMEALNSCEYFDTSSQTWIMIANLPKSLISTNSLAYRNNLYIFGGVELNKIRNRSVFRYNKQQDQWQYLKFQLHFGIEAACIYQLNQSSFYIFGGRLDNGDTDTIWNLIFTQSLQSHSQCIFVQKGTLSEKKSGLKLFCPKQQNFIVLFGGSKDIVSYYDIKSLQLMNWDGLLRLKQVFMLQLKHLNSQDMKKYLTLANKNKIL